MQCPRCGAQLPVEGELCPACGAPRPEAQPAQQAIPPVQPVQGTQPATAGDVAPPAASGGGPGTYANARVVSSRASAGEEVVSFPDVCKTPAPGGPVPIPYPNIGKSSDVSKGPSKVKTDGGPIPVHPGGFATTTGDEPGTGGGPRPMEGVPGPADTASALMVTGLVIALVAVVLVATGDVGWTERPVHLIPLDDPEVTPAPITKTVRYAFDAGDGGVHATVTVAIALLLALSAVAALAALARPRSGGARLLQVGALALAVGALVASVAGGIAFTSWAEGEAYTDSGPGSTIWSGTIGSILMVAAFAAAMIKAGPVRAAGPVPQ